MPWHERRSSHADGASAWVQSMQRHGYKGAFALAATVDYLFGYDATAQVVEDWMYPRLTE
jgi:cobaltochelatase CobN